MKTGPEVINFFVLNLTEHEVSTLIKTKLLKIPTLLAFKLSMLHLTC